MRPNTKKLNFTIVGTDTNVGKTVVSLLLMKFLHKKGYQPKYLKPIQTGCQTPHDSDSDARFVYQHVSHLRQRNPDDSVIYCLPPPKAPWFAARNTNTDIQMSHLQQQIQTRLQNKNPVVLEAAGGLFVPITDKVLFIELLSPLDAIPILVARAGLGTINHTLLSITAMIAANMAPMGIILSNPLSVPGQMVDENIEAIEQFSNIPVMGVLDKIENFDHISNDHLNIFRHVFQP